MRIDGRTELYGLLGHPIAHSLSPAIYNEFFGQFGMNSVYVPLEVATDHFDEVFRSLKRLAFAGFNVTSPYKETVVPHLDRLEGVAAEIGCVNTISRDGERWRGINTDGEGICRWIESSPTMKLRALHVVVLGAGNAARAVFRALLDRHPRSLTIINRRFVRFEDEFFRKYEEAPGVSYQGIDRGPVEDSIARADLVINVTSYGLGGRDEGSPAFPMLRALRPSALVIDTNYSASGETAFRAQLPAGIRSVDGKGMLLYLAREAFRAWTGKDPDLEPNSRDLAVTPLP